RRRESAAASRARSTRPRHLNARRETGRRRPPRRGAAASGEGTGSGAAVAQAETEPEAGPEPEAGSDLEPGPVLARRCVDEVVELRAQPVEELLLLRGGEPARGDILVEVLL